MCLCEVESLICSFYLSVAARKLVKADTPLYCWDVKQSTKKNPEIQHICHQDAKQASQQASFAARGLARFTSALHLP